MKPMKKKDLIRLDEETALNLHSEFDEEERLARDKAKKEKEANISLIKTWDDIQTKIDADHQLAERMQAQKQEELFIEENATLFQQLLEKRRKHFAAKKAEEKRNKPPTKAQQRKIDTTQIEVERGLILSTRCLDKPLQQEDEVWRNQQEYKVLDWKLYDSSGVHSLYLQHVQIYMLVEKKYPLAPLTLSVMLEKKLIIDYEMGSTSGALISGGQFVARLVEHFGLLTEERLRGLTVIAWVAQGPERQPDATTGALRAAEDAPADDEGAQADPAPVQAPQPPLAARTMPHRMARLKEDRREIRGALGEQQEVLDSMARDFSRFTAWTITSLSRMMDRAGVTYTSYSESPTEYQRRRVRQRIDGASTSTSQ
ncbi:hypothetical protein Tco_0975063 [Tanacetum coccineum]|uniref:Uncharacterized protein n=1 Tax=Tanacetum coccineum TaxID=301880 RepID=A0ABQ5EDG5_9ASTR